MRERPNVFAISAASLALLIAVWPVLYAMLVMNTRFPQPPEWTMIFLALGSPGFLIVDAIAGDAARSFPVGLFATWVFYFAIFRVIACWPVFRQWMRLRAERYAKVHHEKR